jgi:hypothetical protein
MYVFVCLIIQTTGVRTVVSQLRTPETMVFRETERGVPQLKLSNSTLVSILRETEIKKQNSVLYVLLDIFIRALSNLLHSKICHNIFRY